MGSVGCGRRRGIRRNGRQIARREQDVAGERRVGAVVVEPAPLALLDVVVGDLDVRDGAAAVADEGVDRIAGRPDQVVVRDRDIADRAEVALDEDVRGVAADDRVVLDEDAVLVARELDAVVVAVGPGLQIMDVVALDRRRPAVEEDAVLGLADVVPQDRSRGEDAGVGVVAVADDVAVLDRDSLRAFRIDSPEARSSGRGSS